jgi:predicted esterase YcpF (UPF0227 family)
MDGWHLDRKVPIALILALIAQGAVALSWANYISSDVQQLKIAVAELKVDSKRAIEKFEAVVELRADMRNLLAAVNRLEGVLEKKK